MTKATLQALEGLRDLSVIQWYAVPLLAVVFYIYTIEAKKAREARNWDALVAAAAIFGADFLNESWNGWVLALTGHSALWTVPGPSALRVTVGWNLEIIFMFSLLGFVFYHSLSGRPKARILGLPEKWFFAIAYSVVCVFVECCLNAAGALVWEYPFWSRSLGGVWLVFIVGYFWFFAWAILALSRPTTKAKVLVAAAPYAAAIILDVVAACLGWRY
jgi:hypothetical protein